MKACSFFGHRDVLSNIQDNLTKCILYAIESLDITTFYVGGYGAFDLLVTEQMQAIKRTHPQVKLYLALAYLRNTTTRYTDNRYDGTVFFEGLETGVKRFAIVKRNRLMVDHSDVIICYIRQDHGGAYTAVRYAKNQGKTILNCLDFDPISS